MKKIEGNGIRNIIHTNICIIDKKFYPLLSYSKEEVIEYMKTHNLIVKTQLAIWRIYNLYNS